MASSISKNEEKAMISSEEESNEVPAFSKSAKKNCVLKRRCFDDEEDDSSLKLSKSLESKSYRKRFIERDNCIYFRDEYYVSNIKYEIRLFDLSLQKMKRMNINFSNRKAKDSLPSEGTVCEKDKTVSQPKHRYGNAFIR
jgi:hypothetical protein